jgi:ABC-type sugar transport system substrate-binding protein
MLNVTRRSLALLLLALLAAAAPAAQQSEKEKEEPPFHEYKGVRIGMLADEARKKLGEPADKSDTQDFYSFSDSETAQIYYDAEKKVFAISVIYMGAGSGVPTAKAVLGDDIEPKPDGSMHQRLDFPKAGYWLAYSRTAGDSPLVTITLRKK